MRPKHLVTAPCGRTKNSKNKYLTAATLDQHIQDCAACQVLAEDDEPLDPAHEYAFTMTSDDDTDGVYWAHVWDFENGNLDNWEDEDEEEWE